MKHHNLKSQIEKFACESFLQANNKTSDIKSGFVRFGNPTQLEPDCICSNNLAIEVLGAYDNEYQAEKISAEARGKKQRKTYQPKLSSLSNLEQKIFEKQTKLEKGNYSGHSGKIILVCHLHSPLIETREVQCFIDQHIPFRYDGYLEKYFDEIWIVWKENDGNLKVTRLE